MFTNTMGKGVHLKFDNGYVASIQWGPGNYCDNYNASISEWAHTSKKPYEMDMRSEKAEIFFFSPFSEEGFTFDEEGNKVRNVAGYLTVDEVFRQLDLLRALPKEDGLEV